MKLDMFTDLLFLGITLSFVGTVLLGVTVIKVHSYVIRERQIDQVVLKEMRRERRIGILAIILIIAGYILEMIELGYLLSF